MAVNVLKTSVDAVIAELAGAREGEREDIFDRLMEEAIRLGDDAVAGLISSLDHQDIGVRQAVSAALSEVVYKAATHRDRLRLSLRDSDPVVRGNVAMSLANMGSAAEDCICELKDALQIEEDDWACVVMMEAVEKIQVER